MRSALLAVIVGAALCLVLHADEGEIPPIPEPAFDDPALGEEYARGVKLLEGEVYKEAEKIFRRLRRVAPEGPPREGAERCYLEAKGGIAADKIQAQIQKEQWRKALAECEEAIEDYKGTFTGEKLAKLHKLCTDEIYFIIEDFEEDDDGKEGDSEDDDGGMGDDPRRRWGRGESGYGLNTKVVEGTRKEGTVRDGERALEWRTGREFSYVTFEHLPDAISDGFLYLNLSIRAKDTKKAPALRILFDCQEGEFGWGGDRGRWGRRGGARVLNRLGYHTAIETAGKWRDLRIDLRKLKPSGDVSWDDVRCLRIIHMPGGDGRVLIDNVRLERK